MRNTRAIPPHIEQHVVTQIDRGCRYRDIAVVCNISVSSVGNIARRNNRHRYKLNNNNAR